MALSGRRASRIAATPLGLRASPAVAMLFTFVCAAAALPMAAAPAATTESARGLRFNSPGVLDLANRELRAAGAAVEVVALSDADAERIFAAGAVREDEPALAFSDDVFGCRKPSPACSQQHERELIAASAGAVRRDGKRLVVRAESGTEATFMNWKQPATKTADGDEEKHWYLGTLPGSGYRRVEVEFGHDAPGNYLVDPQSGKVAFVHNTADLAVPSPDGRLLVTWNSLNPPLSLRVAALDAGGPRLALQCEAPEGGQPLTPVFKGWHAAAQFDFVVEVGTQGKSMARLALSARESAGQWRLAASDLARLQASGLVCSIP